MKFIYSILCLSIVFAACEEKHEYHDDSAHEKFVKNSETVLANLEGWQNESVDYSQYAADFVMQGTGYGESDSISLDDMIKMDKHFWASYDFKIVSDSINLLPGVNAETKKADGSVRHYTDWEVTLSATDSTEAKSGVIKLYESFDFNDEGKIIFQQTYGDFTGLMMHLHGGGDHDMDMYADDDDD
ncbi:MAG: hypothetical protein E2O83_09045 [Bacteroidetes bacterium]|nr:MAG: hypothetical protein E2O83_09045 [Bacteroidota bacterium]